MGAQDDIVEFLLLNGVDTTPIDNVSSCVFDIESNLLVPPVVRPAREPSIMQGG